MLIRDKYIHIHALMLVIYCGLTAKLYQSEEYLSAIVVSTVIGGSIVSIINRYLFLKFRRETEKMNAEFRKLHGDKED